MKLAHPRSHQLMFDALRASMPMQRFNEFLHRWFGSNEPVLITFLTELDQLGLEIGVKHDKHDASSRHPSPVLPN